MSVMHLQTPMLCPHIPDGTRVPMYDYVFYYLQLSWSVTVELTKKHVHVHFQSS